MPKHIIAMAALAAILGFFAMQTAKSSDTITVGLQSGYPPFEFVDKNGAIIGYDIDVAKKIAEKLGLNLVIKDMEFEGEILSLKQGKIDLIISGMNITPERLREIAMVPYHGNTSNSLSLIFWNEIPHGITCLEDLKNSSISVEVGAYPEQFLKRFPSLSVKAFQGALAPLMDVKLGKSLANLVENEVAAYLASQHSEIKILKIALPPNETVLGFGIGIKKDNRELFDKVSSIIKGLRDSGELQSLEEKWFQREEI